MSKIIFGLKGYRGENWEKLEMAERRRQEPGNIFHTFGWVVKFESHITELNGFQLRQVYYVGMARII